MEDIDTGKDGQAPVQASKMLWGLALEVNHIHTKTCMANRCVCVWVDGVWVCVEDLQKGKEG